MSSGVQALFFGLAVATFILACVISLIRPTVEDRLVAFHWVALGLALAFFVPFVIELRAS